MHSRLIQPPPKQSLFLFGPRRVGKTAWVRTQFPDALMFDLRDHRTDTMMLAAPEHLGGQIPDDRKGWIVVDEIRARP